VTAFPDAVDYEAWVERYIAAWNSNDPAEIGDLFTEEAAYRPTPFSDEWRGRDGIVAEWLNRKDEPGDTTFSYDVIATGPGIGIVRGLTHYISTKVDYYNIWEVTLDSEGRCSRFVEWWMSPPTD
jgi:uncharacterized protein (TIGR02246 family)